MSTAPDHLTPETVRTAMARFEAGDLDGSIFGRILVGFANWYLVTTGDRHALLWKIEDEDVTCAAVMTERVSPDGQPAHFMEMRGRHLVRNLPAEADGLLLDFGRPHSVLIRRGGFEWLRRMSAALDVDDAIDNPWYNQVELFLDHTWLVLSEDERPQVRAFEGRRAIRIFTAEDRLDVYRSLEPVDNDLEAVEMSGRDLFPLLAQRADFQAIRVDPHRPDADQPSDWGPSMAHRLAAGLEFRPEARVLPARSESEIDTFLDLLPLSRVGRARAETTVDGPDGMQMPAIVYSGTSLDGTPVHAYAFEPIDPQDDAEGAVESPSEVLCAGLLADLVRRRWEGYPSRPLRMTDAIREELTEGARWAAELVALLGGSDSLPRETLRTARGAYLVDHYPAIGRRTWIEHARRHFDSLVEQIPPPVPVPDPVDVGRSPSTRVVGSATGRVVPPPADGAIRTAVVAPATAPASPLPAMVPVTGSATGRVALPVGAAGPSEPPTLAPVAGSATGRVSARPTDEGSVGQSR